MQRHVPEVNRRILRVDATLDAGWPAVAHVAVHGDMDLCSRPGLQQRITSALDAGASCLVIDLGDVGFLDCAGLGTLLFARRLVEARGGCLRLTHVPDGVRRVLALTGSGGLLTDVPVEPHRARPPRAV